MSKKHYVYSFISVFVTLVVFAAPSPAAQRGITVAGPDDIPPAAWGTYHALIIGINDYQQWPQLRTAVKDASVLSQVLVDRYGFAPQSVVLRTDKAANRLQIISDIRALATAMKPDDNLLLYYAGHGQLDELTGDGYWIPVDGDAKNPGTWIANSFIKAVLSSEQVQAKNVVVIADSCYSGAMLRGGPSQLTLDGDYMTKLVKAAAKRSRQVISSGGIEPVADGGAEGHSLFAFYLITALKENDREVIDLENLFHTRIWKPVSEIGNQRPNVGRLKTPMDRDGQFVLINQGWIVAQRQAEMALKKKAAEAADSAAAIQAERQRLELERQKFEMEKQLLAQRQELAEQKRDLEKKEQVLALQKMAMQLEAMKQQQKPSVDIPPMASVAPSVAAAPRIRADGAAATIAVLPMSLANAGNERISPLSLANALTDAIKGNQNIRVSHSYYPTIQGVDPEAMPVSSDQAGSVWRKQSFFSEPEPDLEKIIALSNQLGVNYTYSVSARLAPGGYKLNVYLFDVTRKKMHTAVLEKIYHLTVKSILTDTCGKMVAALDLTRR